MSAKDATARIRKVRHPVRFVRVSQETVRDGALSLRALGLLTYLLSLPDDWHVAADRIAGARKEGREAVRAAMRELEAAGYVRRVREQSDQGRWVTTVYVHEVPMSAVVDETPSGTDDGFPGVGSPGVGSPGVNRTTDTNDRKLISAPSEPKRRKRDPLFDAVCETAGIDPSSLPRTQASDIGKTVRDLREVDATPEQVRQARQVWQRKFPHATFTHRVLRAHWSELVTAPARRLEDEYPDLEGIAPL